MTSHFPNKHVVLIPDMAFMIGHKPRPVAPSVDILCFMRGAGERAAGLVIDYKYIPKDVTYRTYDWDTDVCLSFI